MAHILYLSILLVMGLSTINGPFIIWNYIINYMSNEFNPPYVMPHVGFKMHQVTPLWESFETDNHGGSPMALEVFGPKSCGVGKV